jgi:hypothetical protein
MDPFRIIDESRLVNLVTDPTTVSQQWAVRAACAYRLSDTDEFFPEDDDRPKAQAPAACSKCPVATECLATALIYESCDGYRHGWWGGTDPDTREHIANRLGIETNPIEPEIRRRADLARYLRSQNRTIPSIAVELGCSERTVNRYFANPAA